MSYITGTRFPDEIAAWLVGGRNFLTVVAETHGGQEYRNADWAMARGVWDVSEALRTMPDTSAYPIKSLYALFFAASGQLHSFALKAPFDNTDDGRGVLGPTGLGVAATTDYQMYKRFAYTPVAYYQSVLKPVVASIHVFVDGVSAAFVLDATTGIVTIAQPSVGAVLTWTGSYDIPVRFASDTPAIGMDSTGALAVWSSLKLIEVREP